MEKIQLQSHDSSNNYLEQVEGSEYRIVAQYPDYMRAGYDDNNNIWFIDPAGGPMICIGDELEGKKVTKIFHNGKHFVINLE